MKNIREILKRYINFFPQEKGRLFSLIEQSDEGFDMTGRHLFPGHVTASAIVMKEEKILLIFHPFLRIWLQPGGHLDVGEMPWEAAQRELLEETGMTASLHRWHQQEGIPIDIDIHLVPVNKKKGEESHYHYDFRYLFLLESDIPQKIEHEHEICWRNFREIEELRDLFEKIENRIIRN